ncbi:MAG: molecular chaperone TorD family protein, partial [Myxococcales bacterium]|nr:molecular chaperone TorD family protein [Myxococcales bacterium]
IGATIGATSSERALAGRDEAEARGRAYVLLAELLARGPTAELMGPASASPALAAAIAGRELDELAADHQHVFGFSVPPLEGLFLDADAGAGGESAARVRETYAAIGYRVDPTQDEPEHLATELRALAVLSGAEADALEDDKRVVVAELRRLQARLLDAHLLRWLPIFSAAARRVGRPFPSALVRQIEQLVRMHRDALGDADAREPGPALGETLDLDDPELDLRDIARFLTTPARAGVFLGRGDIARVGRAFRLPRGFGGRALMMQHLLRAAARFDTLAELTAALVAIVDESDAQLRSWGACADPWRARASATREALARLGRAASLPDREVPG